MYKITGKNDLSGTVKIGGSKNAALPIIAASLLIKGKTILKNVPRIGDIFTFIDILESLGVKVNFEKNTLTIDTQNISNKDINLEKIKKIRASVLLLSPILHRIGNINIPMPGGCKLGKRPIDDHIKGLEDIGYTAKNSEDRIEIEGKLESGDKEIFAMFGVTPTENLIVANVLRKGKTTIYLSAIEPHVINLIDFLRNAGAKISIRYDHTIIIEGVDELEKEVNGEIISDYIQSGTYAIIGALCSKNFIDIKNARIQDLRIFLRKLEEAGVKFEIKEDDTLRVYRSQNLKAVNIQTNIFPGFPTDLQAPFLLLMTQAEGTSNIHEILFEGRLNWLVELEKMGGKIEFINPHQAKITGKTDLKGGITVTSWDLRAGAAILIAGLIADGETSVEKVDYIERGYEDIFNVLKELGAEISIIK